MAIIILPWYFYFMIRRSRIQLKAATNIKYTLLDFDKIHHTAELEGWKEISNVTSSHMSIKDEETERKHIAKVYRPSSSQCSTSSKTASEISLQATEGSHSSKSIKPMLTTPIISKSKTYDASEPLTSSTTGSGINQSC